MCVNLRTVSILFMCPTVTNLNHKKEIKNSFNLIIPVEHWKNYPVHRSSKSRFRGNSSLYLDYGTPATSHSLHKLPFSTTHKTTTIIQPLITCQFTTKLIESVMTLTKDRTGRTWNGISSEISTKKKKPV